MGDLEDGDVNNTTLANSTRNDLAAKGLPGRRNGRGRRVREHRRAMGGEVREVSRA